MKSIIILYPIGVKKGAPAYQRISSFVNFYKKNNIKVIFKYTPNSFYSRIKLIKFMYKNKVFNIFISMPPFRNWIFFLIPYINLILDIRDGWSIAMKTGYGNTVKPKK